MNRDEVNYIYFSGKLRDELLDGEILYTLMEAKVLVESWRKEYNRFGPIVHKARDRGLQKPKNSIFGWTSLRVRLPWAKSSLKDWYIDRGQISTFAVSTAIPGSKTCGRE